MPWFPGTGNRPGVPLDPLAGTHSAAEQIRTDEHRTANRSRVGHEIQNARSWRPASFFFFICMARKMPAPTSKAQAAKPPTVLRRTRRAAQAQYRLTWVACLRRCGRRARGARASLTYAADDGPDVRARVIRAIRVLVRRGIVRRVGHPIVRALVHQPVAVHVRILRRGTCAATGVCRSAGFRATRPAERVGCSHAAAAATAVC